MACVNRRYYWILLVFFSLNTYGVTYHGRFTAGSYMAIEKFSSSDDGVYRNDMATASGRFFLHVGELGAAKVETTVDLRDTHDLFDKVDKQKLELKEGNTFQAKQASVYYPCRAI